MQIEDVVHISARSNGTVNVQLILERLKGGGRYDSAGAQLKSTTVEQAIELLQDAIDDYFKLEA
jgi:c-di-AMP phosphodiesterase-like protein